MSYSDHHKSILAKAWIKGKFGMKYTDAKNLMSDIPIHERDQAKQALDDLIQDGLMSERQGKDGRPVAILKKQKSKVREIIRDDVPDFYLEKR